MKWVRSYPFSMTWALESGRSFIIDPEQFEPAFLKENWNYYHLFKDMDDDMVLAEWDIAIGRNERRLFEKYIQAAPDRIHVAPYQHYGYRAEHQDFSYLHRIGWRNFCKQGDPFCFYFGFGLIYIPLTMIRQHISDLHDRMPVKPEWSSSGTRFNLGDPVQGVNDMTPGPHDFVNDVTFSWWHATKYDMEPVPIHWDVPLVHLNYDIRPTYEIAREQIEKQNIAFKHHRGISE